jgi:type II secretory pathway pseudopilin PulG
MTVVPTGDAVRESTGRRLPVAEIVVVALVLAAGVGVYWWAHHDQAQLEETKERGAVVVSALESYRARHDTYPGELAELVPEHAARIDEPTWGLERWRYRRFTPEEVATGAGGDEVYFQLSVAANESGYPVLYYDYTARRWVLNN